VGSLQEELKKLSIRAQNWEQLQCEALKSHTAQEEELAFLKQGRQQLLSAQEQSQQEIRSLQEELQKLRSQAQHWEMLHRDREQTLAMMNQELAVCKAELAFFRQERQQVLSALKQSWQEVCSLQEELQKLRSQAQRWEMVHCVGEKTLAMMKEELAVSKLELISFEGELGKISEQQQDANRMRNNHSPRAGGARPEPQETLEEGSVRG
ncbi:hypothetical protein ASZ78_008623, partial [Callipepla squamata]